MNNYQRLLLKKMVTQDLNKDLEDAIDFVSEAAEKCGGQLISRQVLAVILLMQEEKRILEEDIKTLKGRVASLESMAYGGRKR